VNIFQSVELFNDKGKPDEKVRDAKLKGLDHDAVSGRGVGSQLPKEKFLFGSLAEYRTVH